MQDIKENELRSPLNIEDFSNLLLKTTGFVRPVKGGEEITTLCPWCEKKKFFDGVNHGHMYINIYSLRTNCYRCNDGQGTVFKLFKYLKVDASLYIDKSIIKSDWLQYYKNTQLKKIFDVTKYKVEEELDDSINDIKKEYLYKRLGYDYNLSNIKGLILNPKKFILENKIDVKDNDFLNYVNCNFVGFLGNRGSIINFRNINDNDGMRYYNLQIKKDMYFKDFYGRKVNNIKKGTNTIVITEGVFDLLTALNSDVMKDIKDKSLFWACSFNKKFTKTFMSILDYCMISRANLIVLSDMDVKEDFYKYMPLHPFINNVEIYWNRYKKDFGCGDIDLVKVKIEDYRSGRKYKYTS